MDKRESVARVIALALESITGLSFEGYTGLNREALFEAATAAIEASAVYEE